MLSPLTVRPTSLRQCFPLPARHRAKGCQPLLTGCSPVARPSALACRSSSSSSGTVPHDLGMRLAQAFYEVQHPAKVNKPYSETVRAFTDSAILAYECGYSEEGVRAALQALRSGSVGSSAAPKGGGGPAGGPPSPSAGLAAATPAAQGSTGLAAAAKAVDDLDENCCLACIAVVWVTLMLLNKSVTRWSTASPLSEPTLAAWKGFVTMIVDGYFDKRMAWYPIDRLQLELLGTHGLAPAPDQVAEWARLVYETLHKVAPIFPSK